jgi:hypothetical protein
VNKESLRAVSILLVRQCDSCECESSGKQARRRIAVTKARIPAAIRAHVMTAHAGCVACGSREANHCGHIVPESKGGKMTKENFVRLCESCNTTQGAVHVKFKAFAEVVSLSATYGEALATIQTNRAYWASYCSAARGGIKLKAYDPA